jgi:hypothetical protein
MDDLLKLSVPLTLGEFEARLIGDSANTHFGADLARGLGDFPGWYPLLIAALGKIEALRARNPEVQVRTLELRESLGHLRWQIDVTGAGPGLLARLQSIVRAAETASAATCQVCGLAGSAYPPSRVGRVSTLCLVHQAERERLDPAGAGGDAADRVVH